MSVYMINDDKGNMVLFNGSEKNPKATDIFAVIRDDDLEEGNYNKYILFYKDFDDLTKEEQRYYKTILDRIEKIITDGKMNDKVNEQLYKVIERYLDKSTKQKGIGLSNACWKGYEAIGMKKKGKKLVPNCVPMKDEGLFNIITLKDGRRGIMKDNKFIEIMRGKGATASFLETSSYKNYMRLRRLLDDFITELENNTNRTPEQIDLLRELIRLKNQTSIFNNDRSNYNDADLDERALHIQFALENMDLIHIPIAETNNMLIQAQEVEPIFWLEDHASTEDVNRVLSANEIRDVEGVGIHKTENYYIQSVVFEKNMFSLKEARKWLKENNYVSKKPDITDTQIRFRQVNPKYIENKGFDRFRTKKLGKKSGISLIIAYKNKMKGGAVPPNNERGRRRMPIVNIERVREDQLQAANIRDLNDRLEEILDYIESSDYENIYYNTTPTTELEGRLVNASYRLINNVTIFLNTLDDYQNNPVNNYTRMFRIMLRINEDIDRYENIRNEYLN